MSLLHIGHIIWTVGSGLAIFAVGLDIAVQLNRIAEALQPKETKDNEQRDVA